MLSSVFPMKNPTAYGKGLSSDSANVVAATFLDRNTSGATGRTQKVRPVNLYFVNATLLNHHL